MVKAVAEIAVLTFIPESFSQFSAHVSKLATVAMPFRRKETEVFT